MSATTYRLEITCDDVGEYDGTLLADLASACAHVMRDVGVVGFAIGTSRQRADEVKS